ncbi:hypothetical protein FK256_03890 [Actinomyces johnsonii]|uniref:Uncharacterized protein n=1 Tax=Actinomyces johnsonii TaxID=544581 RepID=A0A508A2T5_9ACTO|nr:hypothetical protein [Actinomyces johnsonii]KAA8743711.1 hypothetical protein F4W10_03655 [Actinomyces johnsonii]TQD44189.1 hypothetical protein FK256_03890 [Actinomyces johnsonii]
MSNRKPVRPNDLPSSPSRPREVLCILPLLCTLALSACSTSGTASSDAASTPPPIQETSAAAHSAAPSASEGQQKSSATPLQTASSSPSQSAQSTESPTPTPTDAAPGRDTLLNASLPLPSTCAGSGSASFSGGQASLSRGGFARIEDASTTYILNSAATTVVAVTCNGGGSAAFPSLAFYDDELNLVASYDLSKISNAESYEPVVTSLEAQGSTLHVEWSNERLPTDTSGMHTGSGTGSADLSWNGASFDKSNVTVYDAWGNQVTG